MAKCLFIFSSFPAHSMAQCLFCLSGLYSPLVVLETVGNMATDYNMQGALQCLEGPGALTCQAHCNARRIGMPVADSRKRGSALSHGPACLSTHFLYTFEPQMSIGSHCYTRAPCANTSACGAFGAL